MKLHQLFAVAVIGAAFALPAHAQSVKKVESQVHHTLKTAGIQTKAAVDTLASSAHRALKHAGNATKAASAKATGIHRVGGTPAKAAHAVSRAGKRVGHRVKRTVKRTTSAAHDSLSKAGKQAKKSVKQPEQ